MRHCKECGGQFKSRQYNAEFCGTECRRTFNNRRAQRGAVLYDMAMIDAFDSDTSKRFDLEARIKAALDAWKTEDAEAREGRRSWKRPNEVAMDTVRFAGR